MNKMTQRTKNNGNNGNRETFGKWLFIIVVAMFTLFIVRFAYIAINKDVQHVNLRSQAEQIYIKSVPKTIIWRGISMCGKFVAPDSESGRCSGAAI